MKKTLLLMAMALFTFAGANAQNEDSPVFTKTLSSVIEDAKFIVADSHYTTGQDALQKAIDTAEGSIATLASNEEAREALKALQAAIDEFVYGNPHADATEKIQNPSFNKDGNNATAITSWTVKNFKQNRRSVSYATTRSSESEDVIYVITDFVEQWANTSVGNINGTGDISQAVKGLPAGHYRLTADIFANNQRTEGVLEDATGIELYANDVVREIGLTDIGGGTNAAAFSVDFDVKEGEEPTIGFRFKEININWLGWDNVTLFYIGDPEAYNNIVNVEKIAAAKEALAASVKAANEALADENAPFYKAELKAAVDAANALTDAATLDELTEAKTNVDTELSTFNGYNSHYAALKTAIDEAEAFIAGGMTNGADKFQEAINAAKTQLATAASDYTADAEGGAALTDTALAELNKAESSFRVLNASYANPANVITNGDMSSTAGWTILAEGANPDLHINTSGSVTNFSTPFMECWVNNTNYGKTNYATQTVNALPDGQELPAGYYVLKAAALATRQDQAGLKVSGVTLKFQDQEVAVQTENGIAKVYTLGFDKKEAGGELTFGLYIDENTDANWIAWDEVELQLVGDKDKYIADRTKAVLGESLEELTEAVANTKKAIEEVDLNGVVVEDTDLGWTLGEAQYVLENPGDEAIVTKEYIAQLIKELSDNLVKFYSSGVSPKAGKSFDFTSFIVNADFDVEATTGWTAAEGSELPSGTDCPYWWYGSSTTMELTQEFYQELSNMPAGNYVLDVNAAIRVDMTYATTAYTAENLPSNMTYCKVFANDQEADVHPFFYEDEAKGLTLENMMEMTNDWDYRHGNGTLIDYMLKQSGHFNSLVPFTLEKEGNIKIGFRMELPKRGGQMPFINYFHLYYYGTADPTAINGIAADNSEAPAGVYNLQGQYVGPTTNGLAKGLYIVGGQKVIIR